MNSIDIELGYRFEEDGDHLSRIVCHVQNLDGDTLQVYFPRPSTMYIRRSMFLKMLQIAEDYAVKKWSLK